MWKEKLLSCWVNWRCVTEALRLQEAATSSESAVRLHLDMTIQIVITVKVKWIQCNTAVIVSWVQTPVRNARKVKLSTFRLKHNVINLQINVSCITYTISYSCSYPQDEIQFIQQIMIMIMIFHKCTKNTPNFPMCLKWFLQKKIIATTFLFLLTH